MFNRDIKTIFWHATQWKYIKSINRINIWRLWNSFTKVCIYSNGRSSWKGNSIKSNRYNDNHLSNDLSASGWQDISRRWWRSLHRFWRKGINYFTQHSFISLWQLVFSKDLYFFLVSMCLSKAKRTSETFIQTRRRSEFENQAVRSSWTISRISKRHFSIGKWMCFTWFKEH